MTNTMKTALGVAVGIAALTFAAYAAPRLGQYLDPPEVVPSNLTKEQMTAVREWLLNLLREYRSQHGDVVEIDLENPDFLEFATIKAQQTAAAFGCNPHIDFNDEVKAWYLKATQPILADGTNAPDGLNAQLNQRSLWFTNAPDMIETMGDADTLRMDAGQDLISFGADDDAIMFGDAHDLNGGGYITFDQRGAGSIYDASAHSKERIVSSNEDTKTISQLAIQSDEIVLSTHGGDLIIELLPEYP